MSRSLGLSVGVASLVAARVGGAPMAQRSVLTMFDHRPPEVGVPDDNLSLNEPGLTLSGFVERVGDPASIIGPDGSAHRNDELAAEALDAVARTAGYGAPVAVAVPAHWDQTAVAALREALRPKTALAPQGVPPMLIDDATTALAALYSRPGFPTDGMVVLCDFGASGTSVTLTDAAANFQHIGETIRYPGFSGDQIDQAILTRLQTSFGGGNADAVRTGPVGPLSHRLDQCRHAKEQLSAATVTVVPAEMPGNGHDARLSRTELENLISENLERLLDEVTAILRGNEIETSRLAAIATVGGGACIPLITHQLERRLQVPVVSSPQPTLSAAIGAAMLAGRRSPGGAVVGGGGRAAPGGPPAAPNGVRPNGMDFAPPTRAASTAWAAGAARAAAGESVEDGVQSATYRALAWSQEASTGDEPLPYTGDDHRAADSSSAPPPAAPTPAAPDHSGQHKRPGMLFGVAAVTALAALLGVGVVAYKLSSADHETVPRTTNVPTPSRLPSVGTLTPEPSTTPQPATNPSPTQSVVPEPSTTQQPLPTTTTTITTTTTTPPSPTTTTTPSPTTSSSYPPVTPPSTYPPVAPTYSYPPIPAPPVPPLVPAWPTYGR